MNTIQTSSPATPLVTCPDCGKHMRLAAVIPGSHFNAALQFTCYCGFHYKMSTSVQGEAAELARL
ncbi:MAG TPA: hypothetical protein VFW73_02760 [Lacipirellulaceae bacterium]|nr:hypothetical protein [Lacipirellulaceae bacterium]